jgi:hypothetical protein
MAPGCARASCRRRCVCDPRRARCTRPKREWGLTSLPAPTVRGRRRARERGSCRERVPAEAFRPRSVPFRGPHPKPKLLPGIPGPPAEASSLPGSRRGKPRRVPERRPSGPKSVIPSLPGHLRSELRRFPVGPPPRRTSPAPFRGPVARRLRFRWTLLSESGVGIGLRLRLALLPPGRPTFRRLPGIPEGPPLVRLSAAAGSSFSPFPEEPRSRLQNEPALPIRFAPEQCACG